MEALKRVCSPFRRREPALPTLLFLVFSGVFASRDTILPGESISGNQTLISKNGVFELGFFSAGPGIHHFLGVQFKKMPSTSPKFWVGDRIVITDLPGASLEVFGSSLYIKEAGASLWQSPVPGGAPPPAAAVAVLLNSGNLVVRDQANSSRILWQSFDYPGDSLLPGARLGFGRGTGGGSNISMTYKDNTHNGSVSVDKSRKNGFVLSTDGHDLPGTFPDWMVSSQDNGSSLVLKYPESPNVTEFLQYHLGQVRFMRWMEDSAANTGGWVVPWTFPSDCKSSGFFCGNFGACTNNIKCDCVDGFEPKYPEEWRLGYFVTGCSRSLPLSCEADDGQTEKHDDSFIPFDKLHGLPYDPQSDLAESDEDCREACLSKCYCIAYAYDSGCKLWYYNLYNLSVASRPPYNTVYVRLGSKLKAKNGLLKRGVIPLVVSLVAVVSIIVIPLFLWIYYRRDLFTCRKFEVEGSLIVYSYSQIKKATRKFSDKLGEDGFGSVFRGTMSGPTVVAVKSLKGLGDADKQFRTEVQTVGLIQHTNLVRLLGFCVKGDTRILVYEYVPNGSLESHIFSEKSSSLNWDLRYQIALGTAKGLAYLHEGCQSCIIHCDIKPANILLDTEFCAKIADFGMAKLLGRDFNSVLTTIRGTRGYLAPEWMSGYPITKKADVYSFGIVLLEIISGKRSTKRLKFGSHRYFPHYAAVQVNEGNVLPLLDDRLEGNANIKELDVACRVACWCIQDIEENRPSMGQVVHMLEGVVNTEIPPIPSSFQNLVEGESSGEYSI